METPLLIVNEPLKLVRHEWKQALCQLFAWETPANGRSRSADALTQRLCGLMRVKHFTFNCACGARRLMGTDWRCGGHPM